MKELKNLSLKEEVDREAEQIEKEVLERKDLDDIKVSEEMETSLFNKIQEYEYDKRAKIVYRKSRKRNRLILVLAAVFLIVFGSVITGVGSKSYWKVLWDREAGDEKLSYVDVDEMDSQETEDLDEVHIFREINNKLGISAVRFKYVPKGMALKRYDVDEELRKAVILYEYNGEIIKYTMYMNDADSSFGQIEPDTILDQYEIEGENDITITIKVYQVKDENQSRYIAEFEYMDAQYELKGAMGKAEFEKILENLKFY